MSPSEGQQEVCAALPVLLCGVVLKGRIFDWEAFLNGIFFKEKQSNNNKEKTVAQLVIKEHSELLCFQHIDGFKK